MKDSSRKAITDANIWIDLHCGGITAEVFKLGLELAMPDLVAEEMLNPPVDELTSLGLKIIEIPGLLLEEIPILSREYRKPSRRDLSALAVARSQGAMLLTGDKDLRTAARVELGEVRGTLWLLKELVASKIITGRRAAASLRENAGGSQQVAEARVYEAY